MILPVLCFLLFTTIAESLDQGESCSFTNGSPGVCELLNNCQSVKEQLIVGNPPNKICGFSGLDFQPIICCPPINPTNLTGDKRGAISRQKCAEYSQYVYVLKKPPILIGNQKEINVSECATAASLIYSDARARPGEFPHMAAIGYDLENGDIGWHCSGALISETFVLTAAHCTQSRVFGNASWVRVGDLNLVLPDDTPAPQNHRIIELIRHPDYKLPSKYHDIALLRLETRVPFNRWIRPACLSTVPFSESPRAIATGWNDIDGSTNDLMKIILSIVDSKSCNTRWTSGKVDLKLPNGVVDDWLICADTDERDACQGDTGGPLTIHSQKEYCMYDILGITIQGNMCNGGNPGIYTRVYNYVPWIESIVWNMNQ